MDPSGIYLLTKASRTPLSRFDSTSRGRSSNNDALVPARHKARPLCGLLESSSHESHQRRAGGALERPML
jgi:hypothetical protein